MTAACCWCGQSFFLSFWILLFFVVATVLCFTNNFVHSVWSIEWTWVMTGLGSTTKWKVLEEALKKDLKIAKADQLALNVLWSNHQMRKQGKKQWFKLILLNSFWFCYMLRTLLISFFYRYSGCWKAHRVLVRVLLWLG